MQEAAHKPRQWDRSWQQASLSRSPLNLCFPGGWSRQELGGTQAGAGLELGRRGGRAQTPAQPAVDSEGAAHPEGPQRGSYKMEHMNPGVISVGTELEAERIQ